VPSPGVDRLSVVSPGFALALIGAAALAWLSLLHQRRARAAAVVVLAVANVLSAASVATAVNEHYSYWPTVGDVLSAADLTSD
jgi:hypothetical protein